MPWLSCPVGLVSPFSVELTSSSMTGEVYPSAEIGSSLPPLFPDDSSTSLAVSVTSASSLTICSALSSSTIITVTPSPVSTDSFSSESSLPTPVAPYSSSIISESSAPTESKSSLSPSTISPELSFSSSSIDCWLCSSTSIDCWLCSSTSIVVDDSMRAGSVPFSYSSGSSESDSSIKGSSISDKTSSYSPSLS